MSDCKLLGYMKLHCGSKLLFLNNFHHVCGLCSTLALGVQFCEGTKSKPLIDRLCLIVCYIGPFRFLTILLIFMIMSHNKSFREEFAQSPAPKERRRRAPVDLAPKTPPNRQRP